MVEETVLNELLLETEQRIKRAYLELGHDHGWSFLYTPGITLSVCARFLFMGLNPGGTGNHDKVALTAEAGNAYNPEVENDWLDNGQASPLQMQVVNFYKLLSDRISPDFRTMMNRTLAANFCPFRSISWSDLKEKKRTIMFCNELWANILLKTQISTIVCMSSIVRHHMSSIIVNSGGHIINEASKKVGWGKVSYSVTKYIKDDRNMCMVCLPHLSRYKIFGRTSSNIQANEIADTVAESLSNWSP